MRKKQKVGEKRKTIIFFIPIIVAALFLAAFFASHGTLAFPEGWGIGIWNDTSGYDALNNEQFSGKPSIGWLKSSSDISSPCFLGAPYSLYFSSGNPGEDERYISGKAWFGIGSRGNSSTDPEQNCQNDLPSLGWLDFGANPAALCAGQADCHAARWYKNGSDDYTGYLDGYAHIESMGANGWVRLRGTNYNVSSNSSGVLSGFGWNSGNTTPADNNPSSLVGNSGLGWINMDGLKITECSLDCATKQLCRGDTFSSCDSSFCVGSGASCALESNNISWTCSSGCGTLSCGDSNISWIDAEEGVCGQANGGSICDPGQPANDILCANGTTPHKFERSGITATWVCGSNQCGGHESPTCSASTRCGWIETAP